MRLLPHTWKGSHPAFPQDTSPDQSCYHLLGDFTMMSAASGVAWAHITRKQWQKNTAPASRPLLGLVQRSRWTAGVWAVGIIGYACCEWGDGWRARRFLPLRHIQPPKFKFADRLSIGTTTIGESVV